MIKWLAFILLMLNILAWYASSRYPDSSVEPQGQLPRVVDLKLGSASSGRACTRVGWFENEEAAVALAERSDVDFYVEQIERNLPPLNWVLIPPQPEEVALEQFSALLNDGMEVWIVRSGEYRNAISLGLFESKSAAETVLAEKKDKNLDVVLAKFPRNRIGYALVFEVGPEAESLQVQTVEAEFGRKFEIFESAPCKGLATSNKTP